MTPETVDAVIAGLCIGGIIIAVRIAWAKIKELVE